MQLGKLSNAFLAQRIVCRLGFVVVRGIPRYTKIDVWHLLISQGLEITPGHDKINVQFLLIQSVNLVQPRRLKNWSSH